MSDQKTLSAQQHQALRATAYGSSTVATRPRTGRLRERTSTIALGAVALSGLVYTLAAQLTALISGTPLGSGTPSARTLEDLVAIPLLGLGLLLASWWALSLWFLLAALLLPRTGAASRELLNTVHRCGPRTLRRLTAVGVGAGLALGALPAQATEDTPDLGWVTTTPTDFWVLPTDLSTPPDLPSTSPNAEIVSDNVTPTPVELTSPPPHTDRPAISVTAGDSLWRLAAAHLPANASAAEIAASWHAWYELNRAVIGTNPDILTPGQVLTIPVTADVPSNPIRSTP